MILATIVLFSGCSTIKKTKVVLPPSWINMKKIAPYIYVNEEMTEVDQKLLIKKIPVAKNYVADVWGNIASKPIIYACSTTKCFKKLGGGARAHQIINHLVLSPRALTAELISHEWSHAELYKRVGGILNWRKIPSWFDEGLSVLVSHEPRHNAKAWNIVVSKKLPHPKKEELISLNDWNKSVKKYQNNVDPNEIVVTYATAGHIVEEWYRKAGKEGLLSLIKGVKNGKEFNQLYDYY